MIKERFDVIASSLGSYFGVGFNSVDEQFAFDLGQEENYIDAESQERMDLGTMLEDAVLNFFEKKLNIKIDERNTEVLYAFDDKLKCKLDGTTVFEGMPTVVECKVSNSQSKKFTEDLGYYLQCQAYMHAKGEQYQQALLLGLYQGKPTYTIIRRNEEVIDMIRQVVDFVYDCLVGLADPADFPYDLTAKFNKKPVLQDAQEELTDTHWELLKEYSDIKAEIKGYETRLKELEDYFKANFKNIKAKGHGLSVTIATYTRSGGLDVDAIQKAYPNFVEADFKKSDYEYVTLRVTKDKPR